jgi:hypothetical protein
VRGRKQRRTSLAQAAREDKASIRGGGRHVEHGEKAARSASASGAVGMRLLASGARGMLGV